MGYDMSGLDLWQMHTMQEEIKIKGKKYDSALLGLVECKIYCCFLTMFSLCSNGSFRVWTYKDAYTEIVLQTRTIII